jgi:hypothetical protein
MAFKPMQEHLSPYYSGGTTYYLMYITVVVIIKFFFFFFWGGALFLNISLHTIVIINSNLGLHIF